MNILIGVGIVFLSVLFLNFLFNKFVESRMSFWASRLNDSRRVNRINKKIESYYRRKKD